MATKLKVNYEFVGDSATPVTRTESIKHGDSMLNGVITSVVTTLGTKSDKSYVDSQDALKANKAEVNAALATKANAADVTSGLATKADASTVSSLATTVSGKADSSIVSALSSKVSSNETNIATQASRIDNIAALPSGSTSGDAELMDIRVGADSVTYTSAGASIRSQITDVKSDLVNSENGKTNAFCLGNFVNGILYGADGSVMTSYKYSISTVDITSLAEDTIFCVKDGFVVEYCTFDDNDKLIKFFPNIKGIFTIPKNTKFRLNIDKSPRESSVIANIYEFANAVTTESNMVKIIDSCDNFIIKKITDDIEEINGNKLINKNDYEMGAISYSSGNAVYYDSDNRVRTKKGFSYNLKAGNIISLSDYSTYKMFIVWENSNGKNYRGWLANDFTCFEDGNYVICISKVDDSKISNIIDVVSIFSIKTTKVLNQFSEVLDIIHGSLFLSKKYENLNLADGYFNGSNQFNGESISPPQGDSAEKYTTEYFRCYGNGINIMLSYLSIKNSWIAISFYDKFKNYLGVRNTAFNDSGKEINVFCPFIDNAYYFRLCYRSYGEAGISFEYASNIDVFKEKAKKYTLENIPPFYANITPRKTRYIHHRGYCHDAPENSIPSFYLAGQDGAFAIECDVQFTSDNIPIIMHDATIDRTTNGSGTVSLMTYNEITAYRIDTGSHVSDYDDDELIVPSFKQTIQYCKKYGMVCVVDLAPCTLNQVDIVLGIILEYGMQDTVIIQPKNKKTIDYIRMIVPSIHIMVDTNGILTDAILEEYKEYSNFGFLTPIIENFSEWNSITRKAQKKGFTINVYTIDSNTELEYVSEVFPDFVCTNMSLGEL